jgi:ADP-ribosylglycohydrolase
VFAFLEGASTEAAIGSAASAGYTVLDLPAVRQRVEAVRNLDAAQAASELGLACPAPQALPVVLMLLERFGDDFESALIENVMAGGDNAARALALGMVLGAKLGKAAIPERWLRDLAAASRVSAFLDR